MPLTELAKNTIERPLPQDKIKKRPGKAGMTFDYVSPDFVINLLNEAFDYRWNTVITHRNMVGDTAVVELQLTVWDAENQPIIKTQYGSCDVGRGMGPGEAFKGAASDAMKKAATLLGVALELYETDEAPKQDPILLLLYYSQSILSTSSDCHYEAVPSVTVGKSSLVMPSHHCVYSNSS